MDLLFELLADPIGVYTRYFFFKIIGKKKNIEYLRGNSKDPSDNFGQAFVNTLIGFIVFCVVVVSCGYLMYILNIL